jgi:hypothetical protein
MGRNLYLSIIPFPDLEKVVFQKAVRQRAKEICFGYSPLVSVGQGWGELSRRRLLVGDLTGGSSKKTFLLRAGECLDRRFSPQCLASVGDHFPINQGGWPSAASIFRGFPCVVLAASAFEIVRDPRVQGAVSASKQVNEPEISGFCGHDLVCLIRLLLLREANVGAWRKKREPPAGGSRWLEG